MDGGSFLFGILVGVLPAPLVMLALYRLAAYFHAPPEQRLAAKWIADSMRAEPLSWQEVRAGRDYRRGLVRVEIDCVGDVSVNGVEWGGILAAQVRSAIKARNATALLVGVSEAHQ